MRTKTLPPTKATVPKKAKQTVAKVGKPKKGKHQPPAPPPSQRQQHPPNQNSWDENIADLKAFREKYGTVNVPKKCKDFPALALWVQGIRRRSPGSLSAEQVAQLTDLGFTWRHANIQKFGSQWDAMLDRLKQYKQVHGNCLVPIESTRDRELGNWVKNQRAQYRKGLMSEDRQQKLEELGFEWRVKGKKSNDDDTKKKPSAKLEGKWQDRYHELVEFQAQHNHCLCPKVYPPNPALGAWVSNQRILFSNGLLRPDRKELLDKIGFCWRPDPNRNMKESQKKAFQNSNAPPRSNKSV